MLDDEILVIEEDEACIITVGEQGPPGRDGVSGVSNTISQNFAFGDATPANLSTPIPANKLIRDVRVIFTTAFNGTGCSISIGDSGNLSRLMTTSDNNPTIAAAFEVNPQIKYGVSTQLLLTIVSGAGATQGAGQVIIDIEL